MIEIGVTPHGDVLIRGVALDDERAHADKLGRISVQSPAGIERPHRDIGVQLVHILRKGVLREDVRTDRVQDRAEYHGSSDLHRVIIDLGDYWI